MKLLGFVGPALGFAKTGIGALEKASNDNPKSTGVLAIVLGALQVDAAPIKAFLMSLVNML